MLFHLASVIFKFKSKFVKLPIVIHETVIFTVVSTCSSLDHRTENHLSREDMDWSIKNHKDIEEMVRNQLRLFKGSPHSKFQTYNTIRLTLIHPQT